MAGTDLIRSLDIIDYEPAGRESAAEHRVEAINAFLPAGAGPVVDLTWDHTGDELPG